VSVPHESIIPFYRGKCDPRLPDRRLGLKDAGFNSQTKEAPGYSKEYGNYDLRRRNGLGSPTDNFSGVRLRIECAQILQIERPKSVFDRVADSDNSIFQAVSKQDDERASTAAELRSADGARAAGVESAVALHSISHPRIGAPDTARQLLPAHPTR
jgi:hypothetical protein